MPQLSIEEITKLKKTNRIRRLSPKAHKIAHESGRSTKAMWVRIVNKAKGNK